MIIACRHKNISVTNFQKFKDIAWYDLLRFRSPSVLQPAFDWTGHNRSGGRMAHCYSKHKHVRPSHLALFEHWKVFMISRSEIRPTKIYLLLLNFRCNSLFVECHHTLINLPAKYTWPMVNFKSKPICLMFTTFNFSPELTFITLIDLPQNFSWLTILFAVFLTPCPMEC